jgi:hypothetical protein
MTSFSTTILDTGVAVVVVVAVVAISTVVLVIAREISVVISISAIAGTRDCRGKKSDMFSDKANDCSLGVKSKKCRNRREEGFSLGSLIFKVDAEVVNHFLDLSFNSSAMGNILSPGRMDGESS